MLSESHQILNQLATTKLAKKEGIDYIGIPFVQDLYTIVSITWLSLRDNGCIPLIKTKCTKFARAFVIAYSVHLKHPNFKRYGVPLYHLSSKPKCLKFARVVIVYSLH